MSNYRAELVGVLGDPVDDNPSGVMEEAAFKAAGLNWRYVTYKVLPKDLENAIKGIRALGLRGCNLTMPHKVQVIPYLDELSEAASIIGAVNCIINKDGKLYGENSDGKGFTMSLKDNGIELKGKKITMLGAGGVARAIAVESALAGASEITIFNVIKEQGEELEKLINEKTPAKATFHFQQSTVQVPADTDILINCTPVGLIPNVTEKPDINYDTITSKMDVADVVFNPIDPLFLKVAREHGAHKTVGGIGLLVKQGELNFKWWTGQEAPEGVMRALLESEFGKETH